MMYRFSVSSGSETYTDVEEYLHALCVGELVGILVALIVLGVHTALLVGVCHDILVVEDIVDVKVEVERDFVVDVNELAD